MYVEKFLQQVHRKLNEQGIANAKLRDTCIDIYEGENEIFKIDREGGMFYASDNRFRDVVDRLHEIIQPIVCEVDEYLRAMENGTELKARDFDMPYIKIAEYNEVVLAGREHSNGSFEFATWNYKNNSLYHGHYTTDYKGAREDFAREIVVPITISYNVGLTGLQFNCNFDEVLTLKSVEAGNALSNLEFTTPGDLSSNNVTFLWDGMDADDSNGLLLYLTFEVPENAEIGTYSISLTIDTACDQNLNDVNVVTKSGKVNIIEFIPGDVNEDDERNVGDIILTRRYIAGGYGVSLVEPAADVDENDEINVKDVILLGIVFAWIFALVGHITSIIGIVLGAKEYKETNKSAGLILSIVGEVCSVISSLIGIIAFSGLY